MEKFTITTGLFLVYWVVVVMVTSSLPMKLWRSFAHFLGRSIVIACPHFGNISSSEFLTRSLRMTAPDG